MVIHLLLGLSIWIVGIVLLSLLLHVTILALRLLLAVLLRNIHDSLGLSLQIPSFVCILTFIWTVLSNKIVVRIHHKLVLVHLISIRILTYEVSHIVILDLLILIDRSTNLIISLSSESIAGLLLSLEDGGGLLSWIISLLRLLTLLSRLSLSV